MKIRFALISAVTLVVVLMCGGALGQADIQHRVHVVLSEDFQAGRTMMPAGEYAFIVDPTLNNVQIIHYPDMHGIFLTGMPGEWSKNGHPHVAIKNVGGTSRLAGITGDSFGIQFLAEEANGTQLAKETQMPRMNASVLGGAH